MADTLSTEELNARLRNLDGWSVSGKAIAKTFAFAGFGEAVRFVNQVAALAEKRDHHPDIDVRYDKVNVSLSTHSAGGVTDQDTELAAAIEEL